MGIWKGLFFFGLCLPDSNNIIQNHTISERMQRK